MPRNTARYLIQHSAGCGGGRKPARVMTTVLKDDTELFKQFMDNQAFRRWLADSVFAMTYD